MCPCDELSVPTVDVVSNDLLQNHKALITRKQFVPVRTGDINPPTFLPYLPENTNPELVLNLVWHKSVRRLIHYCPVSDEKTFVFFSITGYKNVLYHGKINA